MNNISQWVPVWNIYWPKVLGIITANSGSHTAWEMMFAGKLFLHKNLQWHFISWCCFWEDNDIHRIDRIFTKKSIPLTENYTEIFKKLKAYQKGRINFESSEKCRDWVSASKANLLSASFILRPCHSASQIISPTIHCVGSFQSACLFHWVNTWFRFALRSENPLLSRFILCPLSPRNIRQRITHFISKEHSPSLGSVPFINMFVFFSYRSCKESILLTVIQPYPVSVLWVEVPSYDLQLLVPSSHSSKTMTMSNSREK